MEITMPETEEKPAAEKAEEKGAPAPEEKAAPAAPAKEADEKTQAKEEAKPKTPPPSFFVKKRQEKRDAKETEERERLARENDTLKRLLQERQQTEHKESPNIFDDPDGWAKKKEEDIEKKILGSLETREREVRLAQEAVDAEKHLLTREHLRDPAFAADVKSLIDSDPQIQAVAAVSPMQAAKSAYYAVCEARGVAPELEGLKDAEATDRAAERAKGASPTAPPSGKDKRWTTGEVRAYLDAVPMGSKEFKARLAEVKQAQREGRAP